MANEFESQFLASAHPQLKAVFGEAVTWTKAGGAPASLVALVDRDADARLFGAGGEMQHKTRRLSFAAADATGYSKDDTFTFDDVVWKVSDIESENEGIVVMNLTYKVHVARHGEGFRRTE